MSARQKDIPDFQMHERWQGNNKLKFLHRKNRLNVLILHYSKYACSSWYPNLTKKLKNQVTQNTPETALQKCS